IFAGTRDRKPTGMAEVSLTLIDPEVYDGPDKAAPTELDLQDDMPEEDWDEAEVRAKAAKEVEERTEDAQPGRTEEVAAPRRRNNVVSISSAFPDDEPFFADGETGASPVQGSDGSAGEGARSSISASFGPPDVVL